MKKPSMPCGLILFSLTMLFITASICQSQPMIKVIGDVDKVTTEYLIRNCLQQLEVYEEFYLIVNFSEGIPLTQPGFTSYQENTGNDSQPTIRVRVKVNLDRNLRNRVLIHELIHVKQFIKKELIAVKNRDMTWHGNRYYHYRTNPKTAPWEFEAHRDSKKLAKLILTTPDKPLIANFKE